MRIDRRWSAILIGALTLAAMTAAGIYAAVEYWPKPPGPSQAFGSGPDTPPSFENAPPLPEVGLPETVPEEGLLLEVEPQTAVDINASRPFTNQKVLAAAPYRSSQSLADRERAVSCLAIAAWYEAGVSADDQRPVMQTILNRVRHPAFPGTVCGVVFQGQERRTGCQFSFTCDGSMSRRRPSAAALGDARALAALMLSGTVDPRVGTATHYHTNWVVPYWSSSLDKITNVKTHLFFRWKGYWGKHSAFARGPSGAEPKIARMAAYSPGHVLGSAQTDADGASETINGVVSNDPGEVATVPASSAARTTAPAKRPTRLAFAPGSPPGRWALSAVASCKGKPECRVVGWSDPAVVPSDMTASALESSPPDLIYVQVLRNRVQQAYWNCSIWPRTGTAKCIGTGREAAELATGS